MVSLENSAPTAKTVIFLYGSGRSGTTWVEERIATALNAEVVFEPLHPSVHTVAATYAYRYLDSAQPVPELKAFFDALIDGRVATLWTRYRILLDRLIPNRATWTNKAEFKTWVKRFPESLANLQRYAAIRDQPAKVIKLIRANWLMPWLIAQFPNAKHLFLVRHPAAVIESRIRLESQARQAGIVTGVGDWGAASLLKHYRQGPCWPSGLEHRLQSLQAPERMSEFDCHCLLWCLENFLVLGLTSKRNHFLLFYEHLLQPAHTVWDMLSAELKVDKELLLRQMDKPSQQASAKSGFMASAPNVSTDFANLIKQAGEGSLGTLQYYLDHFDITQYSTKQLMPHDNYFDGGSLWK